MGFQIKNKSMAGLDVIEIKNLANREYCNIVPHYGGAINEIVLNGNGKLYSVHKSAKSLDEFQQVIKPIYSGAFLAPFPNRIKHGKYTFMGTEYQTQINDNGYNNALHGYLYNAPFSIINKDEEKGSIKLAHSFQGTEGYPFNLSFENTYILEERKLKICSSVKNESDQEVPFGMGWHPYISLNTTVDSLLLKIAGDRIFEQDNSHIPTGNIIKKKTFRDYTLISDQFMNDCYIMDGNRTYIYDPKNKLEIIVEQQVGQKAFNYCMVYTPPSRDCIAIEPMTCAPDAFNNNHGIIMLSKNKSISIKFSIQLNPHPNLNTD